MGAGPSLSLDHAGCIVRDLDTGQARWERLGFTLSPRSDQMGLDAGGAFTPWASANHCAVFDVGYLELIGIVRPRSPNPWVGFLDRFEGAHITALRCASADAAYEAIAGRSDDFDPPVQRRREAPYREGERWTTRTMGFRNIFSRDAAVPECRYIVIEHQTPEVLWQPCLREHANGARSIESMTLCAEDPEPLIARLERLTGQTAVREGPGARIALDGGGRLEATTPVALADRFGLEALRGAPRVAAVTVGVDDPGATARWLSDRGVAIRHDGASVHVVPDDANGVILEFTARSRR